MAKKSKTTKRKTLDKTMKKSEISRKSAVRRSPIPRATKKTAVTIIQPTERIITFEMIAQRAYHISRSPECRSQDQNWHRAERELREGI